MTADIVATILGLRSPETAALKLGVTLVNELLRHPTTEPSRFVAPLSSTPGRLRLKVSPAKRSPKVAERVQSGLAAQPGVRSATVNPVTGTALVNYDPAEITPHAIERVAELATAAYRVIPAEDDYRLSPLAESLLAFI
jgi:hypothetical protein